MLATDGGSGQSRLASLCRPGPLVLVGCGLVLVFGLFMGLGTISLWTLVFVAVVGVVLGAGYGLGSLLGDLAFEPVLLWLGAVAALFGFCQRSRVGLPVRLGECWIRIRVRRFRLHLRPLGPFLRLRSLSPLRPAFREGGDL